MKKRVVLTRPVYSAPQLPVRTVERKRVLDPASRTCAPTRDAPPHAAAGAHPLRTYGTTGAVCMGGAADVHAKDDENDNTGSLRSPAPSASLRSRSGQVVPSAEFENAMQLMAKLSKAQRAELLAQLALENQISTKFTSNPDLDMWSEAVKTALDDTIGAEDGGNYGSMLVKRLMGSSSCWRPVESFMTASKLADQPKNVRQAVYLMLARLLVDHAAERARYIGMPIGLKFVSQQTGSIRGVFERAFPGYLQAGLAPMVARQMQSTLR